MSIEELSKTHPKLTVAFGMAVTTASILGGIAGALGLQAALQHGCTPAQDVLNNIVSCTVPGVIAVYGVTKSINLIDRTMEHVP